MWRIKNTTLSSYFLPINPDPHADPPTHKTYAQYTGRDTQTHRQLTEIHTHNQHHRQADTNTHGHTTPHAHENTRTVTAAHLHARTHARTHAHTQTHAYTHTLTAATKQEKTAVDRGERGRRPWRGCVALGVAAEVQPIL